MRRFAQRFNRDETGVDLGGDRVMEGAEPVRRKLADTPSALDKGEITAGSLDDINEILYSPK